MSFKPFGFTYTPPATVTSPTPTSTTLPAQSPTVGSPTSGAQSNAGALISMLDDMTTMSQYLQDAIVGLLGAMAVEIDPSIDPDTARALSMIYGTDTPPTLIAVAMYDNLLDAHLGALQLDMSVGNNSPIQPNPVQVSSLMTITKAVENALVQSPSYNNWLPLQLASLKADSIVLQSWKQSLQTYPAFYTNPAATPTTFNPDLIQASTVDVDGDFTSYATDALTRFGNSYSQVYQSMATPSPVEQDVSNIAGSLISQPLPNILMMVGLMTSLIGLSHKSSMDSLQSDANNYSFIRLTADTTGLFSGLDQLAQIATAPLLGSLGSLTGVLQGVQNQVANAGRISTGVLAGLSAGSGCATSNPAIKAAQSAAAASAVTVAGLGTLTAGVKALGETIDWATHTSGHNKALITLSVQQLIERRITSQDSRNSLMCSIRTLGTLINLAKAISNGKQNGTLTANASPQQQQEQANSILNSLQTGSGTTFTATAGSQIIVTPPTLPPVTPPVQRILTASKFSVPLGTKVTL